MLQKFREDLIMLYAQRSQSVLDIKNMSEFELWLIEYIFQLEGDLIAQYYWEEGLSSHFSTT